MKHEFNVTPGGASLRVVPSIISRKVGVVCERHRQLVLVV
jgi:hypothetical protein